MRGSAEAAGERESGLFLKEACGEDEALRQQVEQLLAHEQTAKSFLEAPALEMAAKALAEEPDRVLIGRQIGSYEITSVLGVGGMGEVYRARDVKLGRDVAIKVLPASFVQDPERSHRFKREARMLAALNHPHIARDLRLRRGRRHVPALVMELVEGPDAGGSHRQEARFPSTSVACCQADRGSARSRARARHHPPRSEASQHQGAPDGMVKVLDFGLAKALAARRIRRDLSQLPTVTRIGDARGHDCRARRRT